MLERYTQITGGGDTRFLVREIVNVGRGLVNLTSISDLELGIIAYAHATKQLD